MALHPPGIPLDGVRVLVLEDEGAIADYTCDLLEDFGCRVVGPTPTAERARRLLESEAVDLAILDMNLGDHFSDGVARELERRGVPFFYLTGYSSRDPATEFPTAEILEKPFQSARLRKTIQKHLERARQPREEAPTTVEAVARRLGEAQRVVVLTGAGVSAESEIPTFRDSMEGLWKSFDPAKLATPEAFEADPETVTRWYDFRRRKCLEAEPNPGHIALAQMERLVGANGGRFTLLTQNVDRLHQRAGSDNVVELHGSIMAWRCVETGEEFADLPDEFGEYPPRSPRGTLLRPCVVWFGEALPEDALDAAAEAVADCDLFFSVGTSAVVYPAAGYVQQAAARGATTVEVNRDPTPITPVVHHALHGSSGEILPAIMDAAAAVNAK